MAKSKTALAKKKDGKTVLPVDLKTAGGDKELALGRVGIDPLVKAGCWGATLSKSIFSDEASPLGYARAIKEAVKEVQGGDLSRADTMLVAQAYTLDALFCDLLNRWRMNIGNNFEVSDAYLRLALKSQSQSRATWESLGKIKSPNSPTFIRQANLANGPQQVNNVAEPSRLPDAVATVLDGITGRSPAHGQIENKPNELLGGLHRGMDSGAAAEAVGGDTPVGPLGKGHRTEDRGGEGAV